MKAALRYPGSKWNIANWIVDHLPVHDHYIDAFFGSGAVLFNKARSRHELVNDISGDVVTTFRVIRDQGLDLAQAIELTPWAREEYGEAYEVCGSDLERAQAEVGFRTEVLWLNPVCVERLGYGPLFEEQR